MAPTKDDKQINIINVLLKLVVNLMMYIGAIFCHVIKITHIFHFILFIISGNHIWNGGIPIFIIILIQISNFIIFIFIKIYIYLFVKIMVIKIIDAILCIKKYIIILCELNEFFLLEIRGINDIKFISNPVHTPIHLLEFNTIKVLITIVVKNNVFVDVFIKKKKVNFYI